MFGVLEGTGVSVLDPRFHRIVPGSARIERLWTGARWSEGPAWFAAHNTLVWSDIPNDRMLRYDALTGAGRRVSPAGAQLQRQHGRPRRAGSSPASMAAGR